MPVEVRDDAVVVSGWRQNGMGGNATGIEFEDHAKIIDHEEFEKKRIESKPSGYQTMGFNQGAPVDGLELYEGRSGIRYLVDNTGESRVFLYADRDSLPVRS